MQPIVVWHLLVCLLIPLWEVLTQQGHKVYDGWEALEMTLVVVERTVDLNLEVRTVVEGEYWMHQV